MIEAPAPSQNTGLIGHDRAVSDVHTAFDNGRMPHAWLITGLQGIGKATLAYQIAHLVLSGGANRIGRINPQDPVARLIMAESHHDLFVLRKSVDEKTGAVKETIGTEEARGIEPFFRQTAAHGMGRVAIVDEAHALTRNAQNAILKIVEEPPRGGVVVLTATTLGAILPTIRSRCRVLALDPLSPAAIETVMVRLGISLPAGAGKESLLTYAGGSVGRAIQLMQTEGLPLLDALVALLTAPVFDKVALHALADQIGKKADRELFGVLTELFLDFLRASILAAAKGQGDPTGILARMGGAERLDRALDAYDKTRASFGAASWANLDNKLSFINAITDLAR